MAEWRRFDYDGILDEGVYWFALSSPEFEGDCGDDGRPIAVPTGDFKTRVVLAILEWQQSRKHHLPNLHMCNQDDRPQSDEELVTHYALIETPEAPK